ncbi:MAG: CFI-box-CTERM domain-containing protein [Candidatus Helarchaeota archaeon]
MPIEFVPAVCPKCGGELRVPNNTDVIKCMYCGADIILRDASKQRIEHVVDIEKYMGLAERAVNAKNFEEAYRYATIVLEKQPVMREALLIKGFAAGMLTSPNNSRVKEAKEYFKLGLSKEKSELSEIDDYSNNTMFNQLTDFKTKKIVYGYLLKVANHFKDISNQLSYKARNLIRMDDISVPSEEPDLILLEATKHKENAYDFYVKAYGLTDDSDEWKHIYPHRDQLRDIIKLLLQELLDGGIRFQEEQIEFDKQLAVHGNDVGEKIRKEMSNVCAIFRKHELAKTDLIDDPDFILIFNDYDKRILEIEESAKVTKEEEKCFIASATMGDINHPYVNALRDYRDRLLSTSIMGNLFIKIYCFLSPPLAKIIPKHPRLKEISLRYLVLPAYKKAVRAIEKSDII